MGSYSTLHYRGADLSGPQTEPLRVNRSFSVTRVVGKTENFAPSRNGSVGKLLEIG